MIKLICIPFLIINIYSESCQDYSCDSSVVRALLDSNELFYISVDNVSCTGDSGRIDTLKLDNFGISTIPNSIGKLTSLKYLVLDNNDISIIPDGIGNLANLVLLEISFNNISSIPDTIGNLSNLSYFNIGFNSISIIPDAIGNLINLTWLELNGNHILSITDSIGKLQKVEDLFFRICSLTTLPATIMNLQPINNLNVNGNQLCTLSIGMAEWLDRYDDNDWRSNQDCDTIIENGNKTSESKSSSFDYYQSIPNPFKSITTIHFGISKKSNVWLTVHDINGRVVAELIRNKYLIGQHIAKFDASSLPSGIYLFKLQLEDYTVVKCGILLE